MQNNTITRMISAVGAAALFAVGMATSWPHLRAAQDSHQSPPLAGPFAGGRGPGRPGMGPGGPGDLMELMAGLDRRDLTDAQREQIRAIRDRHADELKSVIQRVQTARQTLSKAVFT